MLTSVIPYKKQGRDWDFLDWLRSELFQQDCRIASGQGFQHGLLTVDMIISRYIKQNCQLSLSQIVDWPYEPNLSTNPTVVHPYWPYSNSAAAGSRCRTLFADKQGILLALQPENMRKHAWWISAQQTILTWISFRDVWQKLRVFHLSKQIILCWRRNLGVAQSQTLKPPTLGYLVKIDVFHDASCWSALVHTPGNRTWKSMLIRFPEGRNHIRHTCILGKFSCGFWFSTEIGGAWWWRFLGSWGSSESKPGNGTSQLQSSLPKPCETMGLVGGV